VALLRGGADQVDTATVHPGRLVRGLRRAALSHGIEIAEHSEVRALERSKPVRLKTAQGSVAAEHVVLATGAWTARVRELRRAILPFASHMVASAPAPAEIAALGWTDGVAISDLADLVHYAQVTSDGRIAFGRGGGALGSFGHVTNRHFRDPFWERTVSEDFRAWFPTLAAVPLTHSWAGPIDYNPSYFPFTGVLGDYGNIHYGVGYSGDGVAQSTFIASILAARVLGLDTEDARCSLARGPRAYYPPEPFRSWAGRAVQRGVLRAETAEAAGAGASWPSAMLRRAATFRMPTWLEPRLRRSQPTREQ
jgi:glycine/D-amino acid oxidase-like deaminating enzyme